VLLALTAYTERRSAVNHLRNSLHQFWQHFKVYIIHKHTNSKWPVMYKNCETVWQQEAKGVWRRLHRMIPCTRHTTYTARATTNLSRVTDWQTPQTISNNRQHLMHSTQPFNWENTWKLLISITRCQFLKRSVSTFPELIIACDVRGRGEWLHCCSWPPLQLNCVAYRLFAHAFRLQTDSQIGQVSQPGYRLHLLTLQAADAKKR